MNRKNPFLSLAVISLTLIVVMSALALGGSSRSHAVSPARGTAQQPTQFQEFNTHTRIVKDNVYYGADGNYAYAYTAKTGKLLWRYKKSASVSVVYLMKVSGGSVFLELWGFANSTDAVVVALNASTGALRWTSPSLGYGAPTGSAYVTNGILYFQRPGPYSYGYLYAISMNNGKILWTAAASTVFGDGQGIFYISVLSTVTEPIQWTCAVNAISGAQLWCYQHAYMVGIGQGVIYATVHDWNNPSAAAMVALRASDGSLLWSYQHAYMVGIGQGVIYARVYDWNNPSAAAVVALRASDGSLLWSYSGPTVATLAGDSVYVLTYIPTTQSATLCALSASAGSSRWCDSGLQYTAPR